MIKDVIGSIANAGRKLFKNWRALGIFLLLYLALLAALYFIVATGVGTVFQVLIGLLLTIIAPIIFFVIQTMAVRYMKDEAGASALLKRSLKDCWKVILLTLPFILLAWLFIYLLGKIPAGAPAVAVAQVRSGTKATSSPVQWVPIMLGALQFIVLCIALPLAVVHLWIAATQDGLARALKGAGRNLLRAFQPGSVLIYLIGLVIFGGIPYFLIEARTTVGGAWVEMVLLGLRLVVAGLLVFAGWIVTLGALSDRRTQA